MFTIWKLLYLNHEIFNRSDSLQNIWMQNLKCVLKSYISEITKTVLTFSAPLYFDVNACSWSITGTYKFLGPFNIRKNALGMVGRWKISLYRWWIYPLFRAKYLSAKKVKKDVLSPLRLTKIFGKNFDTEERSKVKNAN